MFLAALGTAEMAMFGYMGYWVELYCNLKKKIKRVQEFQFKPMLKGANAHLYFREDQGLGATGSHRCNDETGLGERHLLQGELGEEIPKGCHQRWTV